MQQGKCLTMIDSMVFLCVLGAESIYVPLLMLI